MRIGGCLSEAAGRVGGPQAQVEIALDDTGRRHGHRNGLRLESHIRDRQLHVAREYSAQPKGARGIGVDLAMGALDIPYPKNSAEIVPDAVLLPMNGWDDQGYRLGYGAGFFDRTLAALAKKPVVIGVSYEMAHLDTIHPQAWDITLHCQW